MDPLCAGECRERLTLLFERGLKASLAYRETITKQHDVLRLLFPDMLLDLCGTPCLASQEDLIQAGLSCFLKECLTVTGAGCIDDTPVVFKLFLGKSPAFWDEQGRKAASCPVERVQVKFSKRHFTGNMQ